MILLAYVERACRGYLRGDRLAEFAAGLQRGFRLFRGCLLLWRMKEDRGAILRTEIRALAVHLRRVVHLPECVEQLLIGQCRWIESDLHDFGMPGFIVQTSLYVGFSVWPPLYPTTASTTPGMRRNAASIPQKHPAPKVAVSVMALR